MSCVLFGSLLQYFFLFFICDGCLLVVIFYALDLSGVREQVLEEEIFDKYY
jgi:hypothetical protein